MEAINRKSDLEKAKFQFTQNAHCLSSKEFEDIEIKYVSSLGLDRDGEGFYILKTKEWAVDSVDDLELLFARIRKIMNK